MKTKGLVPYSKLSKRKRREIDLSRRKTWGSLNPVTRKQISPKAYVRSNVKKDEDIE